MSSKNKKKITKPVTTNSSAGIYTYDDFQKKTKNDATKEQRNKSGVFTYDEFMAGPERETYQLVVQPRPKTKTQIHDMAHAAYGFEDDGQKTKRWQEPATVQNAKVDALLGGKRPGQKSAGMTALQEAAKTAGTLEKKTTAPAGSFNKADNSGNMKKLAKTVGVADFLLGIRAEDAAERISGAYGNLGKWMGGSSDEYKQATDYGQVKKDIETIDEARRRGLYNQGGDIASMNRSGRSAERRRLEAETKVLKGMRTERLDKQIEDLKNDDSLYYMTGEEFEQKYRGQYEKWLLANGIQEEDYPIEFYRQNVFEDYQKQIEELEKKRDNTRKQIEINEGKLKEIDRFNAMDEGYADLMDPSGKVAGLEKEIMDLQQQMSEVQRTMQDNNQIGDYQTATENKVLYDELAIQLADKQEELKKWQGLETGDGDTEYYNEYWKGMPGGYIADVINGQRGINESSLDRIYSFINEGGEYEERFEKGGNAVTKEYRGAMMMLPKEKEKFTELYNKAMAEGREPTEAKAFMDALQPYLNQRYRTYEELQNKMLARTMPVSSSIVSIGATAAAPFQAVKTAWGNLTNAAWAQDPYSQEFFNARMQSDVEGQISSDLGPVGGTIYKGVMSGLKNAVRGLESMAFGPAAKVGNLALFFGENYYNTYQQKLEETGDPRATGTYAAIDSAIATFFEIASVETMFSESKNMWQAFMKNTIAEMSEEFNEGLLGPYIHKVLDGNMEWEKRANQIYDAGGYKDENGNWVTVDSANEAWKQACREWNNNLFESMVVAGLSAGGDTAVSIANQQRETAGLGKTFLQQNTNRKMSWKDIQGMQIDNALKLVEPASQMKEGTEAREIANDIQNDMSNGKKISNLKMGKLVRAIVNESGPEIQTIAKETLGESFKKRLTDAGSSAEDAAEMSDILIDLIVTGKTSVENGIKLMQNEEANKILDEYTESEEWNQFKEKAKPAQEARNSVMEVITPKVSTEDAVASVKKVMAGAKTASALERMEAEGKISNAALEVISDKKRADIVGIKKKTVEVDNKKEDRIYVKLSDGRDVDISQVKAINEGAAQTLRFLQMDKGRTVGANLMETVLKIASEDKRGAAAAVADAQKMMIAEATGTKAPANGLSAKDAEEVQKAVKADMDAAKAARLSRFREIKPGQSRVTFEGSEYGSHDFNAALNGLKKNVQNEARAAANFAKSAGFDVELYYDESDTRDQGEFSAKGGIRINLAGTYNKAGVHRSALATIGHEATHWMEANSPTAYVGLRNFVFNNLQSKGFDAESILKQTIDGYARHNVNLDIHGAVAEVVAKACEQLLTDENLVTQLKEQDPTTFGKVKNTVEKLLERIRSALGDLRDTSSIYAKAMMDVQQEISRLWMGAYEEAKGGRNTEKALQSDLESSDGTETHYGDSEQFSYRVEDQDELDFLNNQETVTTYKSMQLIDGKLYPPMAAVVAGSMEDYSELGKWEKAAEHPELIKKGNKFTLNKGKGKGSLDAAYNPYMHSSNLMINDQFSGAYNRPNLVTVECKVPVSELTSGYHAEYAKDTVGWHGWHTGPVASQLRNKKGQERQVMLSRWIQPVRIVPDAEVAAHYAELLKDTDIEVPDNVVTPSLKAELIKAGVKISESGRVQKSIREETAADRETRLKKEYSDLENLIKGIGNNISVQDVIDVIGETRFSEFRQWMHNRYGKGHDKNKYFPVNEGDLISFINKEKKLIRDVEEISLIETKKEDTPEHRSTMNNGISDKQSAGTELYPGASSGYSIYDLLDAVNTDQIRFFNKERLKGITVQHSFQEDEDYEAAVKRGDMKTAQRMVDEAAKAAGYTPVVRYHQTGERFTVFNTDNPVAGATDSQTPNGIFFKTNDHDIGVGADYVNTGHGGKIQMPVYLKTENMLHFRDRNQAAAWYKKNVPGYQELSDEWDQIYAEQFKPKFDAIDAEMFNPNTTDERYQELEKQEEELIEQLGEVERAHFRKMRETLNQYFLKGKSKYDGIELDNDGHRYIDGKREDVHTFIVFSPTQIKSADAATYDDNGKLIPLSERFNEQEKDIRYSFSEEADETDIVAENGDILAKELPGGTITQYSRQSWENEDIEDLTRQLVDRGFKKKDVSKWIRDVNGIAKMIADNKELLDYEASPYFTMLKNNQEYVKTLDASTLCAKRLLYQGIFNEIQHLLPNTPILPEDLIKLVNMMKKKGLVTPCGICYVESRRRMLGKYASEWLKTYDGEYKPTLDEVTTTDGLAKLQAAPEGSPENKAYEAFKDAMNAKGSANPKVVQLRTDYRGEIRKMTDGQIAKVKEIGGLRVQSFSDFETVHLIDMMQAVLDMAAKDLTSQAYTKVPAFAWVFGDTGIKINLSLIGEGNGLDENGNLIFSSTEGMDFDEAMRIRNAYSKNVGTILVGMNDEHIIKAMGDDRIDFIIPFHKSGWSKAEMARVSGMSVYKDYTRFQNEKKIAGRKANGKGYQIIPNKKSKITNFGPVSASGKWDGQAGYWDFKKSGIENAEKYLELCAKDQRMPKFANFLVDNGDGSFSLPTDDSERSQNIRKGYWKLLIDFKMYDNSGKGSPQTEVKPNFNMDKAMDVLNSYEGGANTLPTDHEVAQQFAEEYKKEHPGRKQYSFMDETDIDARAWMETVNEASLQTEAEKQLLRNFKSLRMRVSLKQEQERKYKGEIARLEAIPENERTREQKFQLQGYKIRLENAIKVKEAAEEELQKITSNQGYVSMMYRQQRVLNDFVYGRTQAEVRDEVEKLEQSAERIRQRIAENQAALDKMEGSEVIKRVKNMLGQTSADRIAADLKKEFSSTWTKGQIRNYLDPILLKMSAGQDFMDDVRQLAEILVNSDSRNVNEDLSALRGLTITLGKGAQAELKAQHSSLKEVRARLAGTGITVKFGDRSTLETDIEDLRAEYPNMPEMGDEKNALENFLTWVEGLKQASANQEFYEQRIADAIATVTGLSAAAADDIYLPADARARNQVLELVEYVKALKAETKQSQQALLDIAKDLENMQKAGRRASGMANTMTHDANVAIDYFNRMAKIAEDTAKQRKQSDLIQQLKSKHAEQILKNNEEWRNLIERDKKAREVAEDNRQYRGQINTALKRMYDLLKNPKGTKNIPEHMQGVAREVIETIVNNDLNGLKLSLINKQDLLEAKRVLQAWTARDGAPDLSGVNDAESEDVTMHIINEDLMTIYDGIAQYNSDIRGKNKLDTLQQRREILRQIQEAVSEIYDAIRAEGEVQIRRRKVAVADAAYKVWQKTGGKKFREWTGKAGRAMAAMHKAIVSGNMTPEYFFRNIGNEGLSDLWDNYHDAENRNGLELAKAKAKMDAIAEEHGYKNWDLKKKYTVETENGKVEMTLGQIMSLWATWNREQTLGPEMSQHLTQGGFYVEQNDLRDGVLGRTTVEKKAHRVDENDMARIADLLTDEQKAYVNDVVQFMSNDMSELGNEASMAAFGIKLYKEKYYFPFQMWDGIKSRKSNDAAQGANIDRAFHPSFSKTRKHGANNALVIGDFTKTAADHIAGMINYATMGLANESLQKVLNYTVEEGTSNLDATKRNIRAILEETYGQEAMQYLLELQRQLNGGAVRTSKSLGDRAITLFRKNAVAGSLSVALQQPLSYIRAAMMINPKYMTKALLSQYWKGSYKERMEHSGVSVIKEMGRFDMNAGQSAREYLMPDELTSKGRAAWDWATDKATILPELMDRWTWNRMWVAVKAEQHALHPEMDAASDEFLNMVGERFNELMRRTQVYDSVLVKSSNMRSDNYWVKSLTSFMAEPTLTLNVLADAVRSAKSGEKGGMGMVAKAGATFLLSAALQAAFKGLMSTGRTPDEKKTWWENFLYRFWSNLESEADPMQLIPGFNDLITILKDGKLEDDAMGAIGKIFTAGQTAIETILGNGDKGWYRGLEDSAGQLTQLFTNLPAKNIMRDLRAMYNWIIEQPYADRPTSDAVLKYQFKDLSLNADNLIGVINQKLGEAGWETKNAAYYRRIYDAKKEGREQDAQDMIDYLLNAKGVKDEKTIMSGVNSIAKKDENASAEETASFLIGEGADAQTYIKDQMKDGKLTAEEARKLLQENQPEKDTDSIWWTVDRIEWAQEKGLEETPSGTYYRLWDAMDNNSAEEIRKAVKTMTDHGVKPSSIKSTITKQYKNAYLAADSNGKRKIRDAIQKAYKAAGFTAEDADKVINKWK